MNNASVKELLAEHKARLRESADNDGFDTDVLTCYWPEINRADLDACILFLKKWTGVVNYTNDSSAAADTVVAPLTGTKWKRSGTWYRGRIFLDYYQEPGDSQKRLGLFRSLHKGGLTIADQIMEHGCKYQVETDWYLSVATISTLPAASSGIEYRRSAIAVDEAHGTYTYHVDKLTRLYQHVEEYTSRITAGRTIKAEHHLGCARGMWMRMAPLCHCRR